MIDRQSWAEVDLSAIRKNVRALIATLGPGTSLCAVIKANGYGHGAVAVGRACAEAGASTLGVAIVDEGVELKNAGFGGSILVLGATGDEGARRAIGWDLSLTTFSVDNARCLAAEAVRQGKVARLHLKVDTGMNRLGVDVSEAAEAAIAISSMPGARLEGVSSHFSNSDAADESYAKLQLARFRASLEAIAKAGIGVPIRHMANSDGLLFHRDSHFDMVRPGGAMFGLRASNERRSPVSLEPALALRARVTQVRRVAAGETVSYGRTFRAARDSRIAVLPLGYADGVFRGLSNRGSVGFPSGRAPMVGRICMDQLMVDVTDLPDVALGSIATVFGPGGPSAGELADVLGTIDYEVSCALSPRVPRIYVDREPDERRALGGDHD